jgi:hypothetical protein
MNRYDREDLAKKQIYTARESNFNVGMTLNKVLTSIGGIK